MYKEIENILDKFRVENEENIYNRSLCVNKAPYTECYLEDEITKVFEKIGIKQFNFCYVGGFDSPGYSIDCICLSYIDLEGELQIIPINYESL